MVLVHRSTDVQDDEKMTKEKHENESTFMHQSSSELLPSTSCRSPGVTAVLRHPMPNIPSRRKVVAAPLPMDVICGRGKNIAHPGNRRFHLLVSSRKQAYQLAVRREEKTRITTEILEALKSGPEPARFLLRDAKTEEWIEVDEIYAREKISHSLRSKPSEQRRKRSQEKRRTSRKAKLSAEFEEIVTSVIKNQQQLLQAMIQSEVVPSYQQSSTAEKQD